MPPTLATLRDKPAQASPSRLAAAKAALGRGDGLAARRILRPLVEGGQADAETLCLYAEASMTAGDVSGVATWLNEAATRERDAEAKARLQVKHAQVLMAERRDSEALSAALDAAELLAQDQEVAEVFGHALLRNNRADAAVLVFKEAIERAGQPSFRCAVGMIQALDKAGYAEAAIEFGEAVNSLFAGQTIIPLELARIERKLGRFEQARSRLLALPAALRNTAEVCVGLAEVALALHEDEEARHWFDKAFKLNPNDAFLRHVAGSRDASRAADEYVRSLFDSYAGRFEQSLISLGYRVPGLILRALERHLPGFAEGGTVGDVLDLGCGTGLIGVVLHDRLQGRLKGVDLSQGMIDQARAKGIYTDLEVAELTAYLENEVETWRVAIAADVFCYFGDLASTLANVRRVLQPGGLFIFSVERHDGAEPWVKQATGRFAHSRAYIESLLADWNSLEVRDDVLRVDRGEVVHGLLVVARRP